MTNREMTIISNLGWSFVPTKLVKDNFEINVDIMDISGSVFKAYINSEDDEYMNEVELLKNALDRESEEPELIENAYKAVKELLANAPLDEDDADYEEMYAEAKNLLNAIENIGYEF